MRDAASKVVGYVTGSGDRGLFRRALLAVDFRGIPLDFRYTEPIRPTKLERVLYGQSLEVYLREELILTSLAKACEVRPVFWIVSDASLLAPLKRVVNAKVCARSASTNRPLGATGDLEPQQEPGVLLLQADAVSAPLRLFLPDLREDEAQGVSRLLVEAASTMELLEPFSRIEKALGVVEEETDGTGNSH